jgi:hypothetical protein
VRRQLGVELQGDSLLTLRQALFHCPELFARIPIGKGRHYHFADDRSSFLIVQDDTRHFSLHAAVDSDAEMPGCSRLSRACRSCTRSSTSGSGPNG